MTTADVLAACEAAGVTLRAIPGGRLHYSGAPSPELLAKIAAHRAELVALLEWEAGRGSWEYPSPEAMAEARRRAQTQAVGTIPGPNVPTFRQCSDGVPTPFPPCRNSLRY